MANDSLSPAAGSGTSDTIGRMMLQQMGSLIQTIANIFPQLTGTATSATAGTNGAVPAQVAGYIEVNVNGKQQKVPYYNP